MSVVAAILGSVGLASLIYALVVLAHFGRKLGAVTKMRPFYYGYYVAIGFLCLALIVRFIAASVFWASSEAAPMLNQPVFYLVLHHLPVAIAMTISLVVTWHYWNWLLKER